MAGVFAKPTELYILRKTQILAPFNSVVNLFQTISNFKKSDQYPSFCFMAGNDKSISP